ncbi:MAG: hypothetical protein ABIG03_02545 [Candidatus Eisenbacteria bacterium]
MRFALFALTLSAVAALCAAAAAEETADGGQVEIGAWSVSSEFNVTLTQNAYSDNWAGSELGSVSWASAWNTLAENQLSPRFHSSTSLKLAFGQTHSQDPDTRVWRRPVKSTDLVDLDSVLRLTYGWVVDPFAGFRVESQFLDESDPTNKRWLDPAVFTESFGVARVFLKDEQRELSTRVGGAVRQHIDRDVPTGEDDKRETSITTDGGVELVSLYRTPLAEDRLTFSSELTAFKALYYSEEDALAGTDAADDWKAVDVNWENTLTANVTNYLMVNLYVQLLYDKQVDDGVRLKETLSMGFTFQLL